MKESIRTKPWLSLLAILLMGGQLLAIPAQVDDIAENAWQKEDFKKILGGIMKDATKADVALFERLPELAEIKGPVPFSSINGLINPHGSLTVISIPSVHVKTISKYINNGQLDLGIYGIDPKTNKIGMRVVDDNEFINVALTDKALLALHAIAATGGFIDARQVRAPFVEGIYADLNQLFFAAGPKVAITSETKAAIEKALAVTVSSKPQFDDVFASFFAKNNQNLVKEFIAHPYGEPHHVLTLDIAYLDVGLSKNVANQTYIDREESTPVSRGKVGPYAHFYVFSKFGLTWDAPPLVTTLGGDIKFLQTNPSKKPERDKSRFSLRFRLPWERSIFDKSSIVISPVWQTDYETQFLPSFWSSYAPTKPRTKLLESLLGFNFNFLKMGMNFDLGGLMSTDFTKSFASDAIDMGPALFFAGKWPIVGPLELSTSIKSYYLFAMPNNGALGKKAFGVEGTAWLRFARVYDFSFSLMTDFFALNLQNEPKAFSLSSIFGLTISYGRLFRLFG